MYTYKVYNEDSFKYAMENLRSKDLIDYKGFQFSPKFCEIHGIKSYADLQANMSHYAKLITRDKLRKEILND